MPNTGQVLFEIPIYSMTRESFDEKYDNFIERQIGSFRDNEEIVQRIRNLYFPMGSWQFNQIIGYIQIVSTDCYFKLLFWYGNKKRYNVDAKSKPMISFFDQGYISYISGESNKDFYQLLREKILSFQEKYCQNRYFDIVAFDNLAPYVDFVRIIESAKRSS